jgi:hypothetical protein
MAYFTYKKLNVLAVTLFTVVFGLLIAAAALDWYKYEVVYSYSSTGNNVQVGSQTLNFTKFFFDFEGQTKQVRDESSRTTNVFTSYSDLGISNVESVFDVSQAFVLLGLLTVGVLTLLHILYFFDGVRNKVLFWIGLTPLRIVLILLVILVLISESIAFLGFLGITQAFDDDNTDCTIGPCQKFSDSVSTELGTQTVDSTSGVLVTETAQWGPAAGWYVVLSTVPITLTVLIVVVLNKFPIPVDSMSTGEAL